jgi:hypothetical protein
MSEVRGQRSEVGSQRSEVRGRMVRGRMVEWERLSAAKIDVGACPPSVWRGQSKD